MMSKRAQGPSRARRREGSRATLARGAASARRQPPAGLARDEGGRSLLRDVLTCASVAVALTGVGASLWVGKTTSDVADETRRDALVAQRAQQFASATTQLASPIQDVQLGAVYSLEALVLNEPTAYASRGCDMIRAFIDSRAERKSGNESSKGKENHAVAGALNVAGRACQGRAGMQFRDLLLPGARLPGATLTALSMPAANLAAADLTRSNLDKVNLRSADMTATLLVSASLRNSVLSRTILTGAQLVEADLSGSDLSAADLTQANLTRANLRSVSGNADTDLVGARMRGADLRNSHLTGVNLRDADLREADLSEANLAHADLRGAQLAGATMRNVDLYGVKHDSRTAWPHGVVPPTPPLESKPAPALAPTS